NGDDDETRLSPASGSVVRRQLMQERRLVADLTATGAAVLAHRPVGALPLSAHEHLSARNPIERLRILTAITSNVALNAARTIARTGRRSRRSARPVIPRTRCSSACRTSSTNGDIWRRT